MRSERSEAESRLVKGNPGRARLGGRAGEPAYKRPFDLAVLFLAHLLLLPFWLLLWAVIPLLIWLEDRGPVFYRQRRVGKDGRVFTVLKFRTMVPGAERLGPKTKWESLVAYSGNDPRLTRVGRLLRKTALDELPQVLSIWKGDMSLVGPRALLVEEQEEMERRIPEYRERLKVRPGLAGLAQILDAGGEPHARLRYDLEYVGRMSPLFDLKILFFSVLYTLTGRWDGGVRSEE